MNAPLFQFNRHREDIEREVVSRAVDTFASSAGDDPLRSYQLVLNDAAIHEINRLERLRGRDTVRLDDWKALARRIGRMTEPELVDEAARRAAWYVKDIVGHFDRRVPLRDIGPARRFERSVQYHRPRARIHSNAGSLFSYRC